MKRVLMAAAALLLAATVAPATAQTPETPLIGGSWVCDFGVQQYRPHPEGFTQRARVFGGSEFLTLYRAAGEGGRYSIETVQGPPSDTSEAVISDGGATMVETGEGGATTFTVEGDELVIASVFETTGEQTYTCRRASDAEGDAAVAAGAVAAAAADSPVASSAPSSGGKSAGGWPLIG